MRIRICERKFPDSGHKPEGKEVFIRRIQKRGQGFSDFGAYLRKTKNLAAGVKFTAGD